MNRGEYWERRLTTLPAHCLTAPGKHSKAFESAERTAIRNEGTLEVMNMNHGNDFGLRKLA